MNQYDSQKSQLLKKKILVSARKQFFTFGYSKSTMDQLAFELHLSKKPFTAFTEASITCSNQLFLIFSRNFMNKFNLSGLSSKKIIPG